MLNLKNTVIFSLNRGDLIITEYMYSLLSELHNKVIKILSESNNNKKEIYEKLTYIGYTPIFLDELDIEKIKTNNNYDNNLKEFLLEQYNKFEMEKSFGLISGVSDCTDEYNIIMKNRNENKLSKEKIFSKFGGKEIVYIISEAKYYIKEFGKYYKQSEIIQMYSLEKNELYKAREKGIIKEYDSISYKFNETDKNKYSIMNKSSMILPYRIEGNTYSIPKTIKILIENLANNNKEQEDYIYKSILWKIKNADNPNIPAIVFFGKQGTGKGSFIYLLSKIFGTENVSANLPQELITSSFGFNGRSLISEFAEIVTHNTLNDKNIGIKLKELIGSTKFTVNEKGINRYEIDNVTWFIISSNEKKPIQLDVGTVNRRFTIIKTGKSLNNDNDYTQALYNDLNNDKVILQFVNWLEQEYNDLLPNRILALENKDKEELVYRATNDSELFWDIIKNNNKKGDKISVKDIKQEYAIFCKDNGIDFENSYKYLWNNSPFVKKTIRIGEKVLNGIEIDE